MGKPVERQNLSLPFFVLAGLIAIATGWGFWEEFVGRRPWKLYQDAFIDRYLVPKAEHDLAVAKAKLDQKKPELARLDAELAAAEAEVRDPARRGTYAAAEERLERLTIRVAEAEQDVRFAKSDLDVAYYQFKHAEHDHSSDLPRARAAMRAVEARVDDLQADLVKATLARDGAQAQVEAFAGRIAELRKAIAALRGPVGDAERALAKAKATGTGMQQYWIPALATANPPGVDRCQNCHTAIDTCGFTDPREILAERARVETAGGTPDDAALAKKYCVDAGRIETWADELAKDPKRTSFTGYDLPLVFRTHPNRDALLGENHPAATFGCTLCHGGEGPQTKGVGGKRFDHGYDDPFWGGWNEPLLDLAKVNGKTPPGHPFVQATCAQCHREETHLAHAPLLSGGRQFMAEIGCYGCHPIAGYEKMSHPGPALTAVQVKLTPAWMENWISYPRGWRPHTRMPNFWPEAIDPATGKARAGSPEAKLRQEEVTAITAYLWGHSEQKAGELPDPPALATADPARGRALVARVGCYACHKIEADDPRRPLASSAARDFAPDLSNIGAKTNAGWLYRWLKNPSAVWPETRMPSLRLSDQEAADIASYLAKKTGGQDFRAPPPEFARGFDPKEFADLETEGQALINKYGCFGCHEIPGFAKAQKIGAPLSDFGRKPVDLLDFGDAITDHHRQTWYNWLDLKLRRPRAYRYERVDTVMPQFDFDDHEVELIEVFLKSQQGPPAVPANYLAGQAPSRRAILEGRKIVDRYNCEGCHVIDGHGGVIRDRYRDAPGKDDDFSMAPPKFNHEGAKIQPAWGFDFLKHPIPLRPWLKVRMPTFPLTDQQATEIIHWFAASAGKSWPYLYADTPLPPEPELAVAKMMLLGPTDGPPGKRGFGCLSCHVLGTPGPNVDLSTAAPNFYLAQKRLRPDWIVHWIENPQAIIDDTKMPSFFPNGTTLFPEYLGGDAKAQIRALRDLLMHLREVLPPPATETSAVPPPPPGKRKG